ncbi:MAG: DUF134 domain-containing protein [Candidatus Omnitrophica bacterium]|nr:DUF134 domain-containing protein [Candidatus Omnitrophota bacterium]
MPRGRPKKHRIIHKEPEIRQFSPRGRIGRPGYVTLEADEYEALRLADYKGLSQKEAAVSMGVSQQTLSRILKRARKTLIEGVDSGRIINISKAGKPAKRSPDKSHEAHA